MRLIGLLASTLKFVWLPVSCYTCTAFAGNINLLLLAAAAAAAAAAAVVAAVVGVVELLYTYIPILVRCVVLRGSLMLAVPVIITVVCSVSDGQFIILTNTNKHEFNYVTNYQTAADHNGPITDLTHCVIGPLSFPEVRWGSHGPVIVTDRATIRVMTTLKTSDTGNTVIFTIHNATIDNDERLPRPRIFCRISSLLHQALSAPRGPARGDYRASLRDAESWSEVRARPLAALHRLTSTPASEAVTSHVYVAALPHRCRSTVMIQVWGKGTST